MILFFLKTHIKTMKQSKKPQPNTFSELVFRGNDLSQEYSDLPYYHAKTNMNFEEGGKSVCYYDYSCCNCILVDFPNIDKIHCYGSINVFIPKTCTNLKELCCNGCPNIIIEEGVNLESLECHGCPSIVIPNSCVNLKDLDCSGCPNIIIPQTCANLEDIQCYGCPNLVIPKTCVNLKHIRYSYMFDSCSWGICLCTYGTRDKYIYYHRNYKNEEINVTIPKECTKIAWFPRGFEKQEKKRYAEISELLLEVTPLYNDVINNIINFLVLN
jgi:hypothetical protein